VIKDLGPVRPAMHKYELTCERCGHKWERIGIPQRCPACDSAYWMDPRGTRKMGRPANVKDQG
jgi:predicted Zn-ribbon and HTH transcriptional regulator